MESEEFVQSPEGLGNTFGRSWELLAANWIMLVPGLVIGIVAAVLVFFTVGAGLAGGVGLSAAGLGGAGLGTAVMFGLLAAVIGLVAMILTVAYTTGMAGAAWRSGRATLDDGAAAFRKDGGSILVAIVLLIILGIVAAGLSIITFGLAMLAFALFFLYTFASIIVGGKSGTEALGDSAKVTTRNFVTTLLLLILICVVSFAGTWLGNVISNSIPLLGRIVALIIQEIVTVYATLVIVGEYIKLSSPPAVVATPTSAGPPATY
jgi:hypothetical protein